MLLPRTELEKDSEQSHATLALRVLLFLVHPQTHTHIHTQPDSKETGYQN